MKYYLISLLFCFSCLLVQGQKVAVKTNLLYDVTTTMNAGAEVGLGYRWTLDVSGNYNPWKFGQYRLKHWMVQPEGRYWFCEKFNGHFLGVHGFYANYNVGGLFFNDNMRNYRYQGSLYGGGISYGYQWVVSDRWSLEMTVGAGYARLKDDKYPCTGCGTNIRTKERNYWGPTKAGLTLLYFLK
ncbi:MAG: DUF3575 domain-containing protein [Culturomica sp.]|jgi:hypothetical protein|nr:DUF3575 domain-containing protein [Culturomica sp.]